jgi:cell division protease FtsH
VREGLRRVLAGPKRKSAPIAEGELEKIAYHEAGHVICAEMCENHANAQHVTIDPRGGAMGLRFSDTRTARSTMRGICTRR